MEKEILAEVERILKDTETFFNTGGEVISSSGWVKLSTRFNPSKDQHNMSVSLDFWGSEIRITICLLNQAKYTFVLDEKDATKFKYLADNLIDMSQMTVLHDLKLF